MSILSKAGSGLTDNVTGAFGLAAIDKDLLRPEVVLGYGMIKGVSAGLGSTLEQKFDM